jgi:hypothetical protein
MAGQGERFWFRQNVSPSLVVTFIVLMVVLVVILSMTVTGPGGL